MIALTENHKPVPMRSVRIMVIEDCPNLAILMRELLHLLGHTVCGIVDDEDQAVIVAERVRPDVVAADVHIRRGSGITAVQRILQLHDTAAFFMTGDQDAVRHALPKALVLAKPFGLQALEAIVGSALSLRQNGPQAKAILPGLLSSQPEPAQASSELTFASESPAARLQWRHIVARRQPASNVETSRW